MMRKVSVLIAVAAGLCPLGCAATARVELAAADAIDEIARGIDAALAEYHQDVAQADDAREADAAHALAARLRVNLADDEAVDADIAAFLAAMARLRADREVALRRFAASADNVHTLREVAEGLRRIAIDSMSLDDETRRYFRQMVDAWQAARLPRPATPAP